MDQDTVLFHPFGIAGAFAALYKDVVAAGPFGRYAQTAQGIDNKLQAGVFVQVPGASGNAVVQVPQIVVNGAAAGDPPRQGNAAGFQEGQVDLCIGALVKADNDRGPVLPETEDRLFTRRMSQQGLVEGHVKVRVGLRVPYEFHTPQKYK